jgi:hypothetical protein
VISTFFYAVGSLRTFENTNSPKKVERTLCAGVQVSSVAM